MISQLHQELRDQSRPSLLSGELLRHVFMQSTEHLNRRLTGLIEDHVNLLAALHLREHDDVEHLHGLVCKDLSDAHRTVASSMTRALLHSSLQVTSLEGFPQIEHRRAVAERIRLQAESRQPLQTSRPLGGWDSLHMTHTCAFMITPLASRTPRPDSSGTGRRCRTPSGTARRGTEWPPCDRRRTRRS